MLELKNNERVLVSIDGADLSATCRALDLDIDFRRLLDLFQRESQLVRALYYTAISEESSLHRLLDWLDFNGYTTVTTPTRDFTDESGKRHIRASIEVMLAVDALRMSSVINHVVLMSGKAEYWPLVAALKDQGKRVTVVSTRRANSHFVADILHRQADCFVDLLDLAPEITRLASDE